MDLGVHFRERLLIIYPVLFKTILYLPVLCCELCARRYLSG